MTTTGIALTALSIAVLALAPLLAKVLAKNRALAGLLDSFVLVAVGGIVALDVVPLSASIAGPVALVAAAIGLFLPIALHRVDHALGANRQASRAKDVVLVVALCGGIFVHGSFDGTALAGAVATPSLAAAVILHRLPAGLALWTLLRPKVGFARFLFVVAAYATGTIAGAMVGGAWLGASSLTALALAQAFVAGSILHVVAEAPAYAPSTQGPSTHAELPPRLRFAAPLATTFASTIRFAEPLAVRAAGVLGAALAGVALFGVDALEAGDVHEGAHLGAVAAFASLACMCAPALLASFLVVGVLSSIYPDLAPWLGVGRSQPAAGGRLVDAALGVAAGLSHPLCSCAVTPMVDELAAKGASPSSSRAFLVAAPELGIPALAVTARLFGASFTTARIVSAALLALVAGIAARRPPRTAPLEPAPRRFRFVQLDLSTLSSGMRHGLVDAVDHTGPWFALGLGVAALVSAHVDDGTLAVLPPLASTALASIAAFPLYLCAAGMTPFAAVLVHKGLSLGAALAFLLVAPATSTPTLSTLQRRYGARAAVFFAGGVVAGAFMLGAALDAFVPLSVAALDDAPSTFEVICLGAVAALLAASLLRQGVRGFVVQVMSPQHAHAADHDHGPGCGHDHGAPVAVPRVALTFDPRGGTS